MKTVRKVGTLAILKFHVFKPLPPPQTELKTGTEIDNAKLIRVEGMWKATHLD